MAIKQNYGFIEKSNSEILHDYTLTKQRTLDHLVFNSEINNSEETIELMFNGRMKELEGLATILNCKEDFLVYKKEAEQALIKHGNDYAKHHGKVIELKPDVNGVYQ